MRIKFEATDATGKVHKRLLQTLTDGVAVVLGLNDRDRDARLLIKDVIRKFTFLLVAACNVSSDDHRARRERNLAPNLGHRVPSRTLDRR